MLIIIYRGEQGMLVVRFGDESNYYLPCANLVTLTEKLIREDIADVTYTYHI